MLSALVSGFTCFSVVAGCSLVSFGVSIDLISQWKFSKHEQNVSVGLELLKEDA